MLRSRMLLFALAALAVLYALKVWMLYALVDMIGFVPLPESLEGAGDLAAPGAGAEDNLLPANASNQYLAAAQALRDSDYDGLRVALQSCEAEDSPCIGLAAEAQLVGAGTPSNLTEAVRLYTVAADLGDADAQYALGVLFSNLFEGDPKDLKRSEALGVLYLYAASVSGHPGALMAMGYRHVQGYGVPRTCNTAALNYIEVARKVAEVYSAGMPQAVELVRLGVDGKDRKVMSSSEVNLFVEIATSGNADVAAAVGKRYLLGIDGFRQNYKKAASHLQIAADKNHAAAMALLGYMYCLGLGVQRSLDVAYSYFVASSVQKDALGHNGLGYIYFHGTSVQTRDLKLAFKHFNESAYIGSADGMFNLASLYLTGTGVEQSFQRATLWYTQALDRGHTPAAYTLAVMHLNGVGTVRNCKIAVDLLKRVCERGSWVSQKLQDAYDERDGRPDHAAWLFLRLAEAGHEVAQMNFAYLLDSGGSSLLLPNDAVGAEVAEETRAIGKIHAQRHYEMSAEQGNALSELRLGDYTYYGWGVRELDGPDMAEDMATEELLMLEEESELHVVRQEADPGLSIAHYKRTAAMRITGEWMQPYVARASFNLGYMHQFGIGVTPDMSVARRHYHRCLEVDPGGVQAPVSVMLVFLAMQGWFVDLPETESVLAALASDLRTHLLALQLVAMGILLWFRLSSGRTTLPSRGPGAPVTATRPHAE